MAGMGLLGLLILTIALAGCSSSSDQSTETQKAQALTAPPARPGTATDSLIPMNSPSFDFKGSLYIGTGGPGSSA
jgi:hypothetical protein